MTKNYLNYLQNQIYFNALDVSDQTNYIDQTYDFTTDLEAIKNYLGFDTTMQRNVFEAYADLTDYYLEIDDSWFLRDQTVFEVTDIYFSDVSDETRFDSSVLLFTRDEIISDYTKQDSSCVLHFIIKINKLPDVTDYLNYSMPLFLKPNMALIANDLILQYNVSFIQVSFFNEWSMLMGVKEWVEAQYVLNLNNKMKLDFLGWTYVEFINWQDMMNNKIMKALEDALGSTLSTIRLDEVKYYLHDYTTFYKLDSTQDLTSILDMFWTYAIDFYTNRVDWTIDPYAGFTTDPDIYSVTLSKSRFEPKGRYSYDKLGVAFTRFLLIRNNIYNWKFTLQLDGTEWWSDYIKFRVNNIIPTWTYDFSFIDDGFDMTVLSNHTADLPLKIDILEYSNNLVLANTVPYGSWISNYQFVPFQLKFMTNKLNVNYGLNSLRIFLSDSLSEEYKDIRKVFVYAPWEVVSEKIAKIEFNTLYYNVQNTWDVDKLLPLSEDFTSYEDLSARLSPDATAALMLLKIPVKYELIYGNKVPITVALETTDVTGNLLPQFEHLILDDTSYELTLEPTLTVTEDDFDFGDQIMLMYRYKFDPDKVYSDQIIQSMNGIIHFSYCPTYLDETNDNYFKEWGEVQFVTTRFKIRKKSHEPVRAVMYEEKDKIDFVPQLSTVTLFDLTSLHDAGQADFGTELPKNGGTSKLNRKTTVKNIPVTLKYDGYLGFTSLEVSHSQSKADGTTTNEWYSPQIGYLKQVNNLVNDGVPRIILNWFMTLFFDDLFNWYMSNVGNDIYITYQFDADKSFKSAGNNSPWVSSMLTCDDTYNNETMLLWACKYKNKPYEGTDAFSDVGFYDLEGYPENPQPGYGILQYHPFGITQNNSCELDIRVSQSNVYNIRDIFLIGKEAFVKKYYDEHLPPEWKFTKFSDIGDLINKKYYQYGFYHRQGFYNDKVGYVDIASPLLSFVTSTGLNRDYNLLVDLFLNNYDITLSIDGSEQVLTSNELLDLYFYDEHNMGAAQLGIRNWLRQTMGCIGSGLSIVVKRVYSADLTVTLDSITEETFSILIEPTSISPLYSSFTIKAMKLVYDEGVAEVTELFDFDELCSQKQSIYDIFGSGIKLVYKYLNYGASTVPISVMVVYNDENGYEKTADIKFELQTKLRLYETSVLNDLIKYGTNMVKAFLFMLCFDQNNQFSQKINNSMNTLMDAFDSNAATVSSNIGTTLATGFLGLKKMFKKIWGKYLPTIAWGAWLSSYLYPLMMEGSPGFSYSSNMSLVMLPHNYELCDDPKVAQILATYITDNTFKINMENPYTKKQEGVPNYIDLKQLIDDYYTKYLDKSGYDINLILVPDTTYNINFKSYLVFSFEFAGKSEGNLPQFFDGIGGGDVPTAGAKALTTFKEFLNLGKMYPAMKDLIQGSFKDLYIYLNVPSYGRVPSGMHPITINNYYYNLQQADYNPFTISGSFLRFIYKDKMRVKYQIVIPFEKIEISMETTSTGIYDINYPQLLDGWGIPKNILSTQFEDAPEEMCGSFCTINRLPTKSTIKVSAPTVIPIKYIDVYVRPLF